MIVWAINLFVLSVGILIVGLIKPKWLLFWMDVGVLLLIYPFSFTLQLLIWVVLSMIIVFSWFKWVSPHLKNKTFSEMSREGMIGQVGSVIEYNSVHEGRGTLRFPAPILGNDEWQFICTDTVDVGDRVSWHYLW
jgi:membrane protein implicated in regulation of membrane protease activity